jgi:hypothetical protein
MKICNAILIALTLCLTAPFAGQAQKLEGGEEKEKKTLTLKKKIVHTQVRLALPRQLDGAEMNCDDAISCSEAFNELIDRIDARFHTPRLDSATGQAGNTAALSDFTASRRAMAIARLVN